MTRHFKRSAAIVLVLLITGWRNVSYAASYIFDDEFNGSSLGSSWMALDVYDNVNHERQCYKPSQITVSGGYLNITSIVQKTLCSATVKSFASGAVVWAPPLSFTYGTVEYRAKFAGGKGTWPAIWLLGANCQPDAPTIYNSANCQWPQAGSNEIDLTEIKFGQFTRPWQNVVSPKRDWSICRPTVSDVSQNFHTYKFIWTPKSLTWYIDGVQTCQRTDPVVIPHTPMFLIINTAIGGDGGGDTVKRKELPQTTKVNYVRVSPYSPN